MKLSALLVIISLSNQLLKKVTYCSVFEKLAANFEHKKACTVIIGVNLAVIHV